MIFHETFWHVCVVAAAVLSVAIWSTLPRGLRVSEQLRSRLLWAGMFALAGVMVAFDWGEPWKIVSDATILALAAVVGIVVLAVPLLIVRSWREDRAWRRRLRELQDPCLLGSSQRRVDAPE